MLTPVNHTFQHRVQCKNTWYFGKRTVLIWDRKSNSTKKVTAELSDVLLYDFENQIWHIYHFETLLICSVLFSFWSQCWKVCFIVITLHAKLSGTMYCYRSCLWRAACVCVCVCGVCGSVTTITRNCVHRSSPNSVYQSFITQKQQ